MKEPSTEQVREAWSIMNERTFDLRGDDSELNKAFLLVEAELFPPDARGVVKPREPRYDEVFFEGRKWLNENG